MDQEFEGLASATTILAANVKATKENMAATMPGDAYTFKLMLKRYTNLIHALFSSVCPL